MNWLIIPGVIVFCFLCCMWAVIEEHLIRYQKNKHCLKAVQEAGSTYRTRQDYGGLKWQLEKR